MPLFIKNALMITEESNNRPVHGGIFIQDGVIQKIVESSSREIELEILSGTVEVVDANGMLLIPGMVNAHYHSYSNLLKGTRNNLPLEIWSLFTVAYGHSLDDEAIRLGVLLGAADMIRSGITSCVDHFPHLSRTEAALLAYEESGLRVAFAPMMHDVPDHHFLPVQLPEELRRQLDSNVVWSVERMDNYYRRLVSEWHGKQGRIEIMLGPNAPQRCTEDMLQLCRELSERYNLRVHTHLLETKIQQSRGRQVHPGGLMRLLERMGLLTPQLSVAHAVWLDLQEIDLLRERGVTVIHNPSSNTILGSGCAPLTEYKAKGIEVALGTDASNSGGPHHMFETMRLAATLQRLNEPDYDKWLQAEDVWRMATSGGAKVMGLADQIGTISAGCRADFVLLRTNTSALATRQDIISQLVFHECGYSTDSVMINGTWTMRDGVILAFDENGVIRKLQERFAEMMERSGPPLAFAEKLMPYFQNMYREFHGLSY
jgi:5-methylthioadenosine/S-adenosylhomocysteine deaminase